MNVGNTVWWVSDQERAEGTDTEQQPGRPGVPSLCCVPSHHDGPSSPSSRYSVTTRKLTTVEAQYRGVGPFCDEPGPVIHRVLELVYGRNEEEFGVVG